MARDVIVLNRMFSGSYLDENLGHEIINLFLCDNEKHYIYLNDNGMFDVAKRSNKIDIVLLTEDIGNNKEKIIGKAKIIQDVYCNKQTFKQQIDYIIDNNIKYGGTYLHNIFMRNRRQSMLLSFVASNYWIVKEGIDIILDYSGKASATKSKNTIIIPMAHHKAKKSLKQYFEPNDKDYNSLNSIVSKKIYWKENSRKVTRTKRNDPEVKKAVMEDLFRNRISQYAAMNKYFE